MANASGWNKFNENPLDAAIRELEEETGIKQKNKLISETKKWINYDLPKELAQTLGW